MSRGTTLVKLLDDYRAEARLSLNPAHNRQVRDTQVKLLQRTQEIAWGRFDWPHMRVERQYPAQAGQRVYDFTKDFDIDRMQTVYFKDGGVWCPLCYGIGSEQYADYDSDLGQRAYPVTNYKFTEEEQIEVWPISDQNGDPENLNGYFKVRGIRKLRPLVDDKDRADLDDRLIVLFAAAETLGASGAKDAARKLELANQHFTRLRNQLTPKRRFSMFGITDNTQPDREYITAYKPAEN